MKFQQIIARLTGFSTPVFGIQWNPPESQRTVARRVIAFLEDRRVLFVPSEMESPDHCVQDDCGELGVRVRVVNECELPPDRVDDCCWEGTGRRGIGKGVRQTRAVSNRNQPPHGVVSLRFLTGRHIFHPVVFPLPSANRMRRSARSASG